MPMPMRRRDIHCRTHLALKRLLARVLHTRTYRRLAKNRRHVLLPSSRQIFLPAYESVHGLVAVQTALMLLTSGLDLSCPSLTAPDITSTGLQWACLTETRRLCSPQTTQTGLEAPRTIQPPTAVTPPATTAATLAVLTAARPASVAAPVRLITMPTRASRLCRPRANLLSRTDRPKETCRT